MLIINNKALKISNKWLNPIASPEPIPPTPTFDEVIIGTQTWMAKNLAIDDGGSGILHFDNVTANGVNFGTQYYYTRDAADRVADLIDGWHLPSEDEFRTLLSYVGSDSGIKLKSNSGWNDNGNGTDYYGFTALPVGLAYLAGPTEEYELISIGGSISIRSSTDFGAFRNTLYMSYEYSDARINSTYSSYGVSVRLIKDT